MLYPLVTTVLTLSSMRHIQLSCGAPVLFPGGFALQRVYVCVCDVCTRVYMLTHSVKPGYLCTEWVLRVTYTHPPTHPPTHAHTHTHTHLPSLPLSAAVGIAERNGEAEENCSLRCFCCFKLYTMQLHNTTAPLIVYQLTSVLTSKIDLKS